MKKLILLAACVALLTLIVASAAFAVTKIGTNGPNNLNGTGGEDVLYGLSGADDLKGGGAADELYGGAGNDNVNAGTANDYVVGGSGRDTLYGSFGNDRIEAADGNRDFIDCGPGLEDKVTVDDKDDVASNCENVYTVL